MTRRDSPDDSTKERKRAKSNRSFDDTKETGFNGNDANDNKIYSPDMEGKWGKVLICHHTLLKATLTTYIFNVPDVKKYQFLNVVNYI